MSRGEIHPGWKVAYPCQFWWALPLFSWYPAPFSHELKNTGLPSIYRPSPLFAGRRSDPGPADAQGLFRAKYEPPIQLTADFADVRR